MYHRVSQKEKTICQNLLRSICSAGTLFGTRTVTPLLSAVESVRKSKTPEHRNVSCFFAAKLFVFSTRHSTELLWDDMLLVCSLVLFQIQRSRARSLVYGCYAVHFSIRWEPVLRHRWNSRGRPGSTFYDVAWCVLDSAAQSLRCILSAAWWFNLIFPQLLVKFLLRIPKLYFHLNFIFPLLFCFLLYVRILLSHSCALSFLLFFCFVCYWCFSFHGFFV